MSNPRYSVSWVAYQKNICNGLSALQQRGEFVDMTIAADGHRVKVHQMVMSLVSPYIQDLITSAACPHPVVILNKVSQQTLLGILQYAYTGEVVVANDNLIEFFSACRELHIRGLEDVSFPDIRNGAIDADSKRDTIDWQSSHAPKKKDINVTTDLSQAADDTTDFKMEEDHLMNDDDDDDDDHFNNDDDMVDSFDTSALKKGRPLLSHPEDISLIKDVPGTALSYSISRLGVIQAVVNRNLYFLRNPRKNGETLWRCLSYKRGKCPAYIVIKDRRLVKSVGTVQAVLNRNLFNMRNKRKSGEVLWRCMNYQRGKCPACIVVNNNRVIKRACAHNHVFHDAQILKRLRDRNMFATLTDVECAIRSQRKPEESNARIVSLEGEGDTE